jgi:hypothetical protein
MVVEQSSTLRLHPDPRVTLSAADYKLQLATSLAIRDDVSRLTLCSFASCARFVSSLRAATSC